MSDNFLSQEEINALMNGAGDDNSSSENAEETINEEKNEDNNSGLTDLEKDLLGEIGNISMGAASTALNQIIGQPVNITTPVVSITTLKEIRAGFECPNIVLDIKYIEGIVGRNILIIKNYDGLIISNLMMGGDGKIENPDQEIGELEISAVSEAMNQMIGSAATSMATMFGKKVDISPPVAKVINENSEKITDEISEDEPIVKVSFKMTVGDLIDSNIMQVFPIETAKNIAEIMMSGGAAAEEETPAPQPAPAQQEAPVQQAAPAQQTAAPVQQTAPVQQAAYYPQQPAVEVQNAAFAPLVPQIEIPSITNIDLILDVPLDISVVLGRAKMTIQDILNLGVGSLIELDKLAGEPVEILVNGKVIASGEVVVVDENFGVRLTNIVSGAERLQSVT